MNTKLHSQEILTKQPFRRNATKSEDFVSIWIKPWALTFGVDDDENNDL